MPARQTTSTGSTPCPCGSGRDHGSCCAPYLRGESLPPDAETLMRSRYTAYVMEDEAYLLATWHPDTRPATLDLKGEPRPRWLGLSVKKHERLDDDHARVEFVARYKIGGKAFRLSERSRFRRLRDRWYYLDGEMTA